MAAMVSRNIRRPEHHVVVGRLHADDLGGREKHEPTVGLDRDPFGPGGSGRRDRGQDLDAPVALQVIQRSAQGLLETLAVEGLQQVVHRRHVEGVEGKALMRRGKDDRGAFLLGQLGDDLQAVAAGHRHVEQDQVGRRGLDQRHGLGPAAALADDLDRRLSLEETAQPVARERLVVDNEGADFHGEKLIGPIAEE